MTKKKRLKHIFSLVMLGVALVATYFFLTQSRGEVAAWFDDNWLYRRSIQITNNTTAETDVYTTVSIDTSDTTRFQGDCGDLRFTKENGQLLPYYISSGCGTGTTSIQVNHDTFPAGAQAIYYYYGNPSADNGFQASSFSTEATNYTVGSIASEETGPGPAAYWKFDEGADNTCSGGSNDVCDSTQNANDGAITGATWQTEDLCVSGKCLYFDGTDDYITRSDSDSLDITVDISLSAWVYPINIGTAGTYYAIVSKTDTSAPRQNYWFGVYEDELMFIFHPSGVGYLEYYTNLANLQNNRWYHVEVVWTDSNYTASFYLNGKQIGTSQEGGDYSIEVNNDPLYLGATDTVDDLWPGRIDEVKIYPYARTATQVKADYQARGTSQGLSARMGGGDMSWLSDGLVGYWELDENTGTTASDSSGAAKTATITAGAGGWTTGQFGSGYEFDSADTEIQSNINYSMPEQITVSGWFYPQTLGESSAGSLFFIASDGDTFALKLRVQGNNMIRYLVNWTSGLVSGGTPDDSVTLNQWQHIALTYDGSNPSNRAKIYINGVSQSITDYEVDPSGNTVTTEYPWVIGGVADQSFTFDGYIDEVRVYSRALSGAEVRDLYNWAPGPVGHWKMDEGTGTSTNDSSGNGNTGTFGDSPTWINGKYGKALEFDGEGSDDNINMGNDSTINNIWDGGGTFEAWIYPRSDGEASGGRIAYKGGGSGWNFQASTDNGSAMNLNFVQGFGGSNGNWTTTGELVPLNTWSHVAVTYDSGSASNDPIFYINGVQYAFASSPVGTRDDDSSYILYTGNSSDGSRTFDGYIDDTRIYNYARTQGQIIEDMNAGHPAPGSPVGSSVLHLRFDEGYGDTANDSSPQNNDGDLGGSGNTCPGGSRCPDWSNSGKFGKALDLSWSNSDYVDAGDINAIDSASQLTISAWVNISTLQEYATVVRKHEDTNNSTMMGTSASGIGGSNDVRLLTSNGIQGRGVTTGDIISTNVWNHWVMVFDGTQTGDANRLKFFFNGNQQALTYAGTIPATLDDNSDSVTIGSVTPIDGLIDEVKIYNFALTEDEVRTEYNLGKSVLMGAFSTDASGNNDWSSSREYCVPGDTSTCNPPVGEWKFDEKVKGDSQSLYDTSENNNTGTTSDSNGSGMDCFVPGKRGSACEFDGADDLVNAGDTTSLTDLHDDAFTVTAWIKADDWGEGGGGITSFVAIKSDTNIGWRLQLRNISNRGFEGIIGTDSTNGNSTSGTDEFSIDGAWHHVAMHYDNDGDRTIYLYIDGQEVESYAIQTPATGTIGSDSGYDTIIGNNSAGTFSYDGLIDDVRIYDYIRTPAQIAWEYNRGAPVGHWKLDECQGAIAYDASGNGNNGTVTIGGTGGQDGIGTCTDGDNTNARYNGRNGKRNASLSFDGADDIVTITDNSIYDLQSSYTINLWFRLDSDWTVASATQPLIVKRESSGGTNGWDFALCSTANCSSANDGLFMGHDGASGSDWHGTDISLSADTWYMTTAVWDSDTEIIYTYIDGKPHGSETQFDILPGLNNEDVAFGRSASQTVFFDGQIDDVRIYNYALTPLQIEMLYNHGSVFFGPEEGTP
jgi:hypothetical protein